MAAAIALADDSVIVREGSRVLAAQPDIEVVVSCGDLPSLPETVESERPDVVVTDIRMPPTSTDEGIRAAVLLREQHPDIGVVVLSNYAEPAYAMALLEPGSEGRAYLLKERVHDRAQLVAAIESVAAGGSVLDSEIIEPLVAAKVRVDRSPLPGLTAREREVLAEIAKGKSNAAIADTLALTKRAVEKHINSIFLKPLPGVSGGRAGTPAHRPEGARAHWATPRVLSEAGARASPIPEYADLRCDGGPRLAPVLVAAASARSDTRRLPAGGALGCARRCCPIAFAPPWRKGTSIRFPSCSTSTQPSVVRCCLGRMRAAIRS
jgi:DNA-binding NarL/FixJ family response regulator